METGFDVDVATSTGYPANLELWAVPHEDRAALETYAALKPKLKQPEKHRHDPTDPPGPATACWRRTNSGELAADALLRQPGRHRNWPA